MSQADYTPLETHLKSIAALQQISGLLEWDHEVMMPRKGNAQRGEQLAALHEVLHAKKTDPRIPEWLDKIDGETLSQAEAANVREARRDYARATKVPATLVAELAKQTALSQQVWSEARAANSFEDFAPTLGTILDLKREEAACIAEGRDLYDVLLDDFEPGMTSAELNAVFSKLRPGLSSLRARISEKAGREPSVNGAFGAEPQMAVARKLATAFGYDWEAGRLDHSVHPFSSGNNNDSRITTRVNPANIFDCLYSTIHEVGHARYEQNMPSALAMTPAGQYASMGVHESQSRLAENQIGRSRPFCEWMYGVMRDEMGETGLQSGEDLYRAANKVESGYIRTEADEVHYNLHVMLRFDLEQALVRGDLQVSELEAAWNDRFAQDFGREVDSAANGVLQDVHWSVGLFGYFPTYALGNVYAGELFASLREAVPALDTQLESGDTSQAMAWLKTHVHDRARTVSATTVIADAVGHAPSERPLLAYLEAKYSDLYDL